MFKENTFDSEKTYIVKDLLFKTTPPPTLFSKVV